MTDPDPIEPALVELDETAIAAAATPEAEAGPPRKRRLALILSSAAVAVVLVAGIAAYAGYQFLTGGAQPGGRIPASVVAYAAVDLKPGVGQQAKLLNLARRFPQAGADPDSAQKVVENLLQQADLPDVDARQDLARWVGVRVSAAVWPHDGQQYLLIAAATRDDKTARDALTRIAADAKDTSVGFVVEDGVALIAVGAAHGAETAKAAAAEAHQHPLIASDRYAAARTWLGADNVAVLWADLAGFPDAMDALDKATVDDTTADDPSGDDAPGDYAPGDGASDGDVPLPADLPKMTGTIAVGVRATDFGIETRYHTFGYTGDGKQGDGKQPAIADAVAKLGAQPGGSGLAVAAALPDLKNSPMFSGLTGLGTGSTGAGTTSGSGTKTPLTKAEQEELAKLMAKDEPTDAEMIRLMDLMERGGGYGDPFAQLNPMIDALSNGTATAAVSKLGEQPAYSVTLTVATAADAQALADLPSMFTGADLGMSPEELGLKPGDPGYDELKAEAAGGGPAPQVTIDGTTVRITSPGYAAGSGTLASSPDFQAALATPPATVQMAAYADLRTLLTEQDRRELGPVRAIGLVSGYDGPEMAGTLRILIG
ncbi:hypothetical protein [Hamadaea tsunoensis]|uniref:hypothetical protein n=1 Tax=Hamadaea tsunoensis TaxID=53368 RepID=UPI00042750DA|nr:hypothetical protein [Hamadaea tsunoensis]